MPRPTKPVRWSGALLAVLMVSLLVGVTLAGVVVYAAWQHNPQCNFHCDGVIHWETLLPLGSMWGLLGFIGTLPLAGIGVLIVNQLLRGRHP